MHSAQFLNSFSEFLVIRCACGFQKVFCSQESLFKKPTTKKIAKSFVKSHSSQENWRACSMSDVRISFVE